MENLISDRDAFKEIKDEGYFISEREDGYFTKYPFEEWMGVDSTTPWDREIFEQLKAGSVLDLGCGSGKHVDYLQEKGYASFGVDISAEIIELGKELNRNVEQADFWKMDAETKYDNIVIMDSSLGFFVEPDELDAFFERISPFLADDGNLIITSINWPEATNPAYKKYVSKNAENHLYPGRVRLRNKTENRAGEWFIGYYYDLNSLSKKAIFNDFFPRWIGFNDGIKYAVKLRKNANKFILK